MSTDTLSTANMSRMVSMDIDSDTASQTRKYPAIRDYYQSACDDLSKPIQLQHGLSNYSSLILGDDRISFTESLCSATYRVAIEEKLIVESPSKMKTKHSRRREYQEAHDKVGNAEIDRLEKVMKDKLIQRNRLTSSPFHVRKAFKFFDREQVMRIHIEGFTRALEFLGFQFSEIQNLALFARYDPDCEGDIDYMNFIETAMFYAPTDIGDQSRPKADVQESSADDLYEVPDVADAELKQLQQAEIRRLFNKVDMARKGSIDKSQFELLLMAMGHNVSVRQMGVYWADLGLSETCVLPFDIFYEWWTSDVGMKFVPNASMMLSSSSESKSSKNITKYEYK